MTQTEPTDFLSLHRVCTPLLRPVFCFPACFFMYMLLLGSIKSFGILYSEILQTTDNGAGSTALIGSSAGFILSLIGNRAPHLHSTPIYMYTNLRKLKIQVQSEYKQH